MVLNAFVSKELRLTYYMNKFIKMYLILRYELIRINNKKERNLQLSYF